MTTVTQPTINEVIAQLSKCTLSGCIDRAFGDGEYMWIDEHNMIIAEAYVSSLHASFWTCPPGSWILNNERSEPSWSPGDKYDESLRLEIEDAQEVSRLLRFYTTKQLSRNDAGEW